VRPGVPAALAAPLSAACCGSATAADEPSAVRCPGETTLEMNECLGQRLEAAQARLDKYLHAATERYTEEQPAVRLGIEASENAFEAYRAIECATVYEDWKDGTLRGVMDLGCRIGLTDERTHVVWANWLQFVDSTPPILPEPKPTPTG
jgi:uncharacterized protein YecT (DUF1311 family)